MRFRVRNLLSTLLPALIATLTLSAVPGAVRAAEFVDGNTPPTVRNSMHSCPPFSIVTGVNVAANHLLCLENPLTSSERVDTSSQWPPDAVTRAAYAYTGPSIHWCGPDQYVTGVDVLNNRFNCARFPTATTTLNYTQRLGTIVVNGAPNPTQRSGMHACPAGTVLVGAHFGNNTFLCAELPFCTDNTHCPSSLETCELQSASCGSNCASTGTGVCRRASTAMFREDNGCIDVSNGIVTDRSPLNINFQTQGGFSNDDARSLQLTDVHTGAIIRVFDSPAGATNDDWTQIFVKATVANACIGTFQLSSNSPTLKVDYHPVNGLDGKVSRVEVRSAIIDWAGGRCLDVITPNNTVQLFTCHAGANQSWSHLVTGEILGWNNLCLEARNTEIQSWPNLAAGQTRKAPVQMAACTGAANQKWSVTEANQIRLFGDMCLDIVGGTSTNGATLQVHPCHGNPNQRWLDTF